MTRWAFHAVAISTLVAGTALADELIDVPSGMPVRFDEMLWDRPGSGLVYRFRFIAPEIGDGGRAFEDVIDDMEHLCNQFALPRLSTVGPRPSEIVISLSEAHVDFGEASPDVTQFFEAYSVKDNACIWEVF